MLATSYFHHENRAIKFQKCSPQFGRNKLETEDLPRIPGTAVLGIYYWENYPLLLLWCNKPFQIPHTPFPQETHLFVDILYLTVFLHFNFLLERVRFPWKKLQIGRKRQSLYLPPIYLLMCQVLGHCQA